MSQEVRSYFESLFILLIRLILSDGAEIAAEDAPHE